MLARRHIMEHTSLTRCDIISYIQFSGRLVFVIGVTKKSHQNISSVYDNSTVLWKNLTLINRRNTLLNHRNSFWICGFNCSLARLANSQRYNIQNRYAIITSQEKVSFEFKIERPLTPIKMYYSEVYPPIWSCLFIYF